MAELSAERKAQLETAAAWIDKTKQESSGDLAARTAKTRDKFLAELEGLSIEQIEYKPSEDEWSVKQVCLHMAHSLRMVTRAIGMLAGGEALPGGKNRILGQLDDDPGDFDAVRARVVETFDSATAAAKELGEGANTDLTYYHPYFGEFDCTAWAAFNILHANVHVQQMQRVKGTEGFPR